MSRRRTPYRTLVRIRRIARDIRVGALRESAHARQLAETEANGARKRATESAGMLEREQRAGESAARVRASSVAVGLLYSAAARKQLDTQQSIDLEMGARELLLEAERSLKGAERLERQHQQDQRNERLRAEQRRLDDRPQRSRMIIRAGLVLVLASGFLIAPAMRAQELARGSVAGLLSEIRTRMTELDRREADLSERQNAIDELERAVEVRIRELQEISESVEERISGWEEAQGAKSLSRLAKIYGAMPAQDAADLIESLELDLATNVFAKMKPKKSAALLPLLSEERALSITRFVGHPLGITPAPAGGTGQ